MFFQIPGSGIWVLCFWEMMWNCCVKRLFWSDFLLGFQTIYWDVSVTFEDEINLFWKTYFPWQNGTLVDEVPRCTLTCLRYMFTSVRDIGGYSDIHVKTFGAPFVLTGTAEGRRGGCQDMISDLCKPGMAGSGFQLLAAGSLFSLFSLVCGIITN